MFKPPVVMDPFRDLDGVWEIAFPGRVRLPTGDALECEVELFLAQRQAGGRFSTLSPAVTRWVGVGQLDLVPVGSKWKDGSGIPGIPPKGSETVVVRGRRSDGKLMDDAERSGRHFPPMSVAGTSCFVLLYDREGENVGRALVPKIEVARALFGTSSDFLLEMMDGVRDGAIAADRGLFDRERSGSRDDGTVVIMARRRLKRSEAVMIAAYLTDATLRDFYNGVFQTLSVDSGFRAGVAVHVDPPFPFTDDTRWEFESRWMSQEEPGRDKPRSVKVVTRVLSIDFPLAFETIEVHVPAGTTQGGAQGLPTKSGRMNMGSSRRASLKTGQAPGRGGRALELLSATVGNVHADKVSVTHVAGAPVAQPSTCVRGGDKKEESDYSTAGRDGRSTSGVTRATATRVEPTPEERAEYARICAISLELTIAAVEDASERADSVVDWEFETHSGPGCVRTVPPLPDIEAIFENMLIVEIQSDRGVFLVADVGSIDLVARSLAIIVPLDGAASTGDVVQRIKRFASDGGGHWKGKTGDLSGFSIVALHRPRSAKEVSSLGTKLLEKVDKALPRAH